MLNELRLRTTSLRPKVYPLLAPEERNFSRLTKKYNNPPYVLLAMADRKFSDKCVSVDRDLAGKNLKTLIDVFFYFKTISPFCICYLKLKDKECGTGSLLV